MTSFDSEYYKLINNAEDYIKYGCISDRVIPEAVMKSEKKVESDTLDLIAAQVEKCKKCILCQKRNHIVPV